MVWGVRRVSPGARSNAMGGARAPSTAGVPTGGGGEMPVIGDADRVAPAIGALAVGPRCTTASAGLAAPAAGSLVDMGKTRSSARAGPRPSTRRRPETRTRVVSSLSSSRPLRTRTSGAPKVVIGGGRQCAKRLSPTAESKVFACPVFAQTAPELSVFSGHMVGTAPNRTIPNRREKARQLVELTGLIMVGVARIELATPAMSTQCSTTELHAHSPCGESREAAL